jgi:hypothetical protein
MNKAYFLRNPRGVSKLKAAVKNGEAREYVIEKVVELDENEYDKFAHNLLSHYDFVTDYSNLTYADTNKVLHCILVTISGATDGILIESEGHALLAAYWSFLR